MGIQRKWLVLKGGSPRRLLTHFVICLNSKSELTAGPSDFSMELSSPSIPALMNHSDSWLPPGISSTTLSLSKFSKEQSAAHDAGQPSIWASGAQGTQNVILELSRSCSDCWRNILGFNASLAQSTALRLLQQCKKKMNEPNPLKYSQF